MGNSQAKARRRTQAALSATNAMNDAGARRASTNTAGAGGRTMTYSVTIPPGVRPGGRFAVMLGGTRHEFTCPQGAGPGSTVHVQGPAPSSAPESSGGTNNTQPSSTSSSSSQPSQQPFHSVPPPRSQRQSQPGTRTYMVRVPAGVFPGQNFAASINGRRFVVQCPPGITAGMPLHIRVPDGSGGSTTGGIQQHQIPPAAAPQQNTSGASQQQTFMVTVPQGIRPGQQFAVMANGQRVTVTCPASCSGGSRVYVRVPVGGQSGGSGGTTSGKTADDEDDYEVLEAALEEINEKQGRRKSAFERKVGEDGKLHWVSAQAVADPEGKMGDLKVAQAEVETDGVVVESDHGRGSGGMGMGLVRQMSVGGGLTFVPANEAAIEVGGTGLRGMTPELLHRASALPFKKKLRWVSESGSKKDTFLIFFFTTQNNKSLTSIHTFLSLSICLFSCSILLF